MKQSIFIDSNWHNVETSINNSWIWSKKKSRFIIPCDVSCITFYFCSNSNTSKEIKLTHGKKVKTFSLTDGENVIPFFLDTDTKFPSELILETNIFVPKNLDPTLSDSRELGQCLTELVVDGNVVEIKSLRNGEFLLKEVSFEESLRTYVITLRSTPLREKYVKDHLKETGMDFKLFYGVDAKKMGITSNVTLSQKFEKIDTWVSVGQVGCFLSHYMLWQLLLNDKYDNFLILEDDVILPENFLNQLQTKFMFIPDDWDIIYLGHESLDNLNHKVINEYVTEGIPACTYAYIIKKSTIPVLLNSLSSVDYPVDTQIRYCCSDKLKSYCINPKMVEQKSSLLEPLKNGEKSLTYDWELNPYGI